MKKLQIFDMDAMAMRTENLSIKTRNPNPGSSHVQVPDLASCPTVNTTGDTAAFVANRLKTFVGLHLEKCYVCVGYMALIDNFDSTKGEIRCYTQSGHRRPPFGKVCLGQQTYTHGDTGCPFYLFSKYFPLLCFN
jgi:hypothetical protein